MARCPGCSSRLGFKRLYSMVGYGIPIHRCEDCGAALRLSVGTCILRILLMASALAIAFYYAVSEEYLGLSRWHDYSHYYFCGTFLVYVILGSLLICTVARLVGPVPKPHCVHCGCDLTGTRLYRCPNCRGKQPWGRSALRDRPEVWLFAATVLGGFLYFFVFASPAVPTEELAARAHRLCAECGLGRDQVDDLIHEACKTTDTRRVMRERWTKHYLPSADDTITTDARLACFEAAIDAGFRYRPWTRRYGANETSCP